MDKIKSLELRQKSNAKLKELQEEMNSEESLNNFSETGWNIMFDKLQECLTYIKANNDWHKRVKG